MLERVASGATLGGAARSLDLSRHGLRYALATRTEHRSRNRRRVTGGRRAFWTRIDPDVYAAMREHAARESMTEAKLVDAALERYLGE